jgi:putative membrane protein
MIIIGDVLVGLVALIHVYILVLEMFLWTSPIGRRAFATTAEFAEQTRPLGMNQGLYNGFLAAGLVWGLVAGGNTGFAAKVFFLVCVAVAGIFGAATVSRRILFVQTAPAVTALVFVIAGQ